MRSRDDSGRDIGIPISSGSTHVVVGVFGCMKNIRCVATSRLKP